MPRSRISTDGLIITLQTVPRSSAGQAHSNGGIGGRSWILIGWSGLDTPGRNNNCSPPNKIRSGRRKFPTARATPRNYGGIFRVVYERSNRNLRIQVSWLPSDSRMPSRRYSQGCDQRLHLLPHRSSMDHHVLSTWRDSNPLIPLMHNVSSAMQHANHRSLIQFLPGSFRNLPWNCHRSSPPCLMRRWAVSIFQLHRRSHPSLRSSRRHLWIHSTSATTGQFQTSPRLPLEAPWACRLRANRWTHGVSPSTPAAAISLLETSFHGDGDNQSDVWHLPSGWRRSCYAARPSLSQRRFWYCRPRDPPGSTSTSLRHLGLALRWIESYLSGRSQFVRFNGESSATTMVTSGARPDPLYRIFCRSHWHRGAARFQRARFCRWFTGLRARCFARTEGLNYSQMTRTFFCSTGT